jgi:cytochrome c556
MKHIVLVGGAAAGLLATLTAAAQFAKPEDAVDYRRGAFTVMAYHFGHIGAMVQGKAPYDAAAAAADAQIVLTMSKLPFTAFVPGTSFTEKGTAKANIWTEQDKFNADAKKMQDAVAVLAEATKTNDLGKVKAAFGPVGQACKACHEDFRNK